MSAAVETRPFPRAPHGVNAPSTVAPLAPHPARTVAEGMAVGCLCLAAVFGPLALGGTATWSRLGIEASMTAAIVLWAVSGRRPTWLVALPVAAAAVACIQILPLPDWLVRFVAPVSAAEWHQAAEATAASLPWQTISVDPAATAAGIRRLLLGLGTIVVVRDLARRPAPRAALVAALALAALVVWACGVAFPVDRSERVLLGFVDLKGPLTSRKSPLEEPVQSAGTNFTDTVRVAGTTYEADGWSVGDGFGSYVSSNHFAGGLELTLPFACGLLLAGWRSRRLPDWLGLTLAAGVCAAGVWTSYGIATSRAGGASLLLGSLVLLALVAGRGWPRRIAVTALLVYAVVLVACLAAFFGPWLGLERSIPEGWQPALRGLRGDGRVVASRVAGWILVGSPFLGTGLDTFGEMQPRYLEGRSFLHYAHNDYAQLLAETGLVGVGLGLALAAVLVGRARRFARDAGGAWRSIDAAAWAGLAALALHSAFDWNLHVPANGLLACVVAGLALGSAGPAAAAPPARRDAPFMLRAVLVVATLASCALLARDAATTFTRRQLATAITAARREQQHTAGADPATGAGLAAAIARGERAARLDPADVRLAVLLGQAHLHRAAASATGTAAEASPDMAAAAAWFRTARLLSPSARGLATEP